MRIQFPVLREGWLSIQSLFRLICLCYVFACLFSACGISLSSHAPVVTPRPTSQVNDVNALVTPQMLTVGSFTRYSPQEYVDPLTGQIKGFDIDLTHALADHLHLRPQIVSADFSSLIDNLLSKRYDIVVSAIAMTPELQKKVSFVPYFRGGEALMVQSGNPDHVEHLSDLCGHAVAVIANTFEFQELHQVNINCMKARKPGVRLHVVNAQSDAFNLLRAHSVSALYADSAITDYAIHLSPQSFAQAGKIVNPTVEGIIVRKEDTLTLRTLRSALQTIQLDGTYHAFIVKWGLYNGDITTVSPPSTQN